MLNKAGFYCHTFRSELSFPLALASASSSFEIQQTAQSHSTFCHQQQKPFQASLFSLNSKFIQISGVQTSLDNNKKKMT